MESETILLEDIDESSETITLEDIDESNYFLKVFPYLDRDRDELIKDIQRLTKYLLLCSESLNTANKYKFFYDFLKTSINKQFELLKISNRRFVEAQESLGCGRHALNNLLGYTKFIKGPNNKKRINLKSYTDLSGQIDIYSLCSQYREEPYIQEIIQNSPELADIYECSSSEYYSFFVLARTLKLIGYDEVYPTSMNLDNFIKIYRDLQNWKIIIADYRNSHYRCAKHQDNKYIYIDSIGLVYKICDSFDEFIKHIVIDARIFSFSFVGNLL